MTTESHPAPTWLQEHEDGASLYLTPTRDTLNEPEGRELTEYLRHRLEGTSTNKVVIDLVKVSLVTSPAIGALIVIHKRLASAEQQLVLTNLAPMLQDAMSFLKLDRVFTIN